MQPNAASWAPCPCAVQHAPRSQCSAISVRAPAGPPPRSYIVLRPAPAVVLAADTGEEAVGMLEAILEGVTIYR